MLEALLEALPTALGAPQQPPLPNLRGSPSPCDEFPAIHLARRFHYSDKDQAHCKILRQTFTACAPPFPSLPPLPLTSFPNLLTRT